jgi:predicted RNA-binding protein with PUA domain
MPKRGAAVEQSGIYWCSVCKLPVRLNKGDVFPECANMCGRGGWEPVQLEETAAENK